jgi:2-polyprenyl-3-methyl-5-hydroxy-6-metoxy-1,4-benzoquinol methylase
MSNFSPKRNTDELRLLVGIASFGEKNIEYLRRVIRTYQTLGLAVDIVVFSDRPKDLGPDVRVVVGLPSKNSWSLPFAHKQIFAENVDRYDLFAYSEDDIEITRAHVDAFVELTLALNDDEIAGYLLYETDEQGIYSMPNVHGPFHWDPASVRQRGRYIVAEFTNDHAACYLLTRWQLKRAIASGGFLREPYEGRYDMLCTASTDPYTSCGFRKVICVSELGRFLVHHLPDRYRSTFRPSLPAFQKQVETLLAISRGEHPAVSLLENRSTPGHSRWAKNYYDGLNEPLLATVPAEAKTILSIGCAWGDTEAALIRRGAHVTALPLDSVIGAHGAERGVEIIYATLTNGLQKLQPRRFDSIIVSDLLHLLDNPAEVINLSTKLLEPEGTLIFGGPNFDYLPTVLQWLSRRANHAKRPVDDGVINRLTVPQLLALLRKAGVAPELVKWELGEPKIPISGSTKPSPGPRRFLADLWRRLGRSATSRDGEVRRQTSWRDRISRLTAEKWILRARLISSAENISFDGRLDKKESISDFASASDRT